VILSRITRRGSPSKKHVDLVIPGLRPVQGLPAGQRRVPKDAGENVAEAAAAGFLPAGAIARSEKSKPLKSKCAPGFPPPPVTTWETALASGEASPPVLPARAYASAVAGSCVRVEANLIVNLSLLGIAQNVVGSEMVLISPRGLVPGLTSG